MIPEHNKYGSEFNQLGLSHTEEYVVKVSQSNKGVSGINQTLSSIPSPNWVVLYMQTN